MTYIIVDVNLSCNASLVSCACVNHHNLKLSTMCFIFGHVKPIGISISVIKARLLSMVVFFLLADSTEEVRSFIRFTVEYIAV